MPSSCWTPVLLLLLLLLSAETEAQSGDGDSDAEPTLSCISDITMGVGSLTCKLVGGQSVSEDDEDDEADGVEKMTACYCDFTRSQPTDLCWDTDGDTFRSKELVPVRVFNVTVHLKKGGRITRMINLRRIVRPRSPRVWNVTFDQETNQTVIYIRTPYHKDYLSVKNQLFQLLIWSAHSKTIQNVSSADFLKIDRDYFKKNTEYHVKVRALPLTFLPGYWSEWSEATRFLTPADGEAEKPPDDGQETYTLLVCLVLVAVAISSVVLFWKNKIFTYMWPSIPHPKHTLVQICKPNKGLLLNLKPEVFSALKVDPKEKTQEPPCEGTGPLITAAADRGPQPNHPCSTQSSSCSRSTTSVSTEELELSALLSGGSSDGEDAHRSTGPSPINVLQLGERPLTPQPEQGRGGNEVEVFGVSQQEEAYVTMSSFYQIK